MTTTPAGRRSSAGFAGATRIFWEGAEGAVEAPFESLGACRENAG